MEQEQLHVRGDEIGTEALSTPASVLASLRSKVPKWADSSRAILEAGITGPIIAKALGNLSEVFEEWGITKGTQASAPSTSARCMGPRPTPRPRVQSRRKASRNASSAGSTRRGQPKHGEGGCG